MGYLAILPKEIWVTKNDKSISLAGADDLAEELLFVEGYRKSEITLDLPGPAFTPQLPFYDQGYHLGSMTGVYRGLSLEYFIIEIPQTLRAGESNVYLVPKSLLKKTRPGHFYVNLWGGAFMWSGTEFILCK